MDAQIPKSCQRLGETFGPIASIPEASLLELATRIRSSIIGQPTSKARLVKSAPTSYHLTHTIDLDDCSSLLVRIPCTGWGDAMTETAASMMESQVATLRFLKKETTMPVPEVYHIDTGKDNEIGAPYICMSVLPGKKADKIWFEEDISQDKLEIKRRNLLTTTANAMAQLSKFSFDKIGALREAGDGAEGNEALTVGPLYEYEAPDDRVPQEGLWNVVQFGPYDNMDVYLQKRAPLRNWDSCFGDSEVSRMMVKELPGYKVPGETFVLSHPEFILENCLADDNGNLTGIVNWDRVHTLPRCVGYASYPGWIARDWDPVMYLWPHRPQRENSPQELEQYRALYNEAMGTALGEGGDWKFTEKSHMRMAAWSAAFNEAFMMRNCEMFVKTVYEGKKDPSGFLFDLDGGDVGPSEMKILRMKLHNLIG